MVLFGAQMGERKFPCEIYIHIGFVRSQEISARALWSARNSQDPAQNPQTARFLVKDPRSRKTGITHKAEKGFLFLFFNVKILEIEPKCLLPFFAFPFRLALGLGFLSGTVAVLDSRRVS